MSLMIWILLLFEFVIYLRSSAQFCMRRYVNGEWISMGDCGGPEIMSETMKQLQLRAEDEKKNWTADKEWTVFQRIMNGDVDFYRGWDDYVKGFGNSERDFWLGLEKLHEMTKEGNMELEINMITRDAGTHWVAKYSNFQIGPGLDNYRLNISGYTGNATMDGLASNQQFTTKDADNDSSSPVNCASEWEGAWWYSNCGSSNLNGNFNKSDNKGIWWWDYSPSKIYTLRYTEMKFRRRL